MTPDAPDLVAEHDALRHGVGAYRLPRDVVSVHGPDALDYLQGQCSQDVSVLEVGDHADALLLAPDGKLDALVRVTRVAPDRLVVDTDEGFGELVVARLNRFRLRTRVEIEPIDWACLALRGEGVAPGSGTGAIRPAVDWHGWTGVDLLGPAEELAAPEGARWCGSAAWEACRVESGVPVMGRELDGRTIAAEADLVGRAVSFTKGCFTGQELVARLDARGSRVARHLVGVVLGPGAALGPEELAGSDLVVPGRDAPVGTVTSAAFCPGVGGVAGLAYAHRSVDVPGPVAVRPAGETGSVAAAEVRPLPMA